jgi:hypothetical protein
MAIRLKLLLESLDKTNPSAIIAAAGYPAGTALHQLAQIFFKQEGWLPDANDGKGSRSYRNNNPGNLDYQDSFKSIDPNVTRENGTGRFARFSKPTLGTRALIELKIMRWAAGNMPVTDTNLAMNPPYNPGEEPTIEQFIYTYAPPSENDTVGYINLVLNGLKSNFPDITKNTKVIDVIKNKKSSSLKKLSTDNITISPNPVSSGQQVTITVAPEFLPYKNIKLYIANSLNKIVDTHEWNSVTRGVLKFNAPAETGLYYLVIVADSDKTSGKLQVQ